MARWHFWKPAWDPFQEKLKKRGRVSTYFEKKVHFQTEFEKIPHWGLGPGPWPGGFFQKCPTIEKRKQFSLPSFTSPLYYKYLALDSKSLYIWLFWPPRPDMLILSTPQGAAAPVMSIILACLALEAKIIKYIMIWSPGPNISNIGSSWNSAG